MSSDKKALFEKLINQRLKDEGASRPSTQFDNEVKEEMGCYKESFPTIEEARHHFTQYLRAASRVRQRWIEEGVWKDMWDLDLPKDQWKHERPMRIDIADEPGLTNFLHVQPTTQQREERVALFNLRKREHEASRPYHRFVHQVSRVGEELSGFGKPKPDANTTAYEMVKKRWDNEGLWNEKWGILPGRHWKHEEKLPPFEFSWDEEEENPEANVSHLSYLPGSLFNSNANHPLPGAGNC